MVGDEALKLGGCSRCGSKNLAKARYCHSCPMPLDGKATISITESRYKGGHIREKLVEGGGKHHPCPLDDVFIGSLRFWELSWLKVD